MEPGTVRGRSAARQCDCTVWGGEKQRPELKVQGQVCGGLHTNLEALWAEEKWNESGPWDGGEGSPGLLRPLLSRI